MIRLHRPFGPQPAGVLDQSRILCTQDFKNEAVFWHDFINAWDKKSTDVNGYGLIETIENVLNAFLTTYNWGKSIFNKVMPDSFFESDGSITNENDYKQYVAERIITNLKFIKAFLELDVDKMLLVPDSLTLAASGTVTVKAGQSASFSHLVEMKSGGAALDTAAMAIMLSSAPDNPKIAACDRTTVTGIAAGTTILKLSIPGTSEEASINVTVNADAKESAEDFNNANKDKGIQIEFPNVTFTEPGKVKDQLGGLTPNIIGDSGISGTAITPAQGDDKTHSFLGKGWGAKIDIQLKTSGAAGTIDILPIKLTFLLDSADLKAAGWTDTDIIAKTAVFLAKALFRKVLAEGDKTEHDLTALLTDIVAIKSDGKGGVAVEFPFLLANGKGDPKLITDGTKRHLVIYDGERNSWLRDPVWLYRKSVVPTGIALTPASLTLKKGGSDTVKASFTPADATERDLVWTVSPSGVASAAKAAVADTWTVKGLAEGAATLTATSSEDSKIKATVTVLVQPAEDELIESLAVTPQPPYHTGEEIEVTVRLRRAASSVKATIKRPDGTTATKNAKVEGKTAWLEYTLESLGTYEVTVSAVDAADGQTHARTGTLTVTESGVKDSSSGGGCNAGALGISGAALLALLRRKRR